MECFKTKYSSEFNPGHTRNLIYFLLPSYLILGIMRLIDKEYFWAGIHFVCAVLMLVALYPVLFKKNRKTKEPQFSGIIIDEEKISVCYYTGYTKPMEILLNDIRSIKLNSPYNDTLEITMKDNRNTRVPLYWFAEEEQKRIKDLLKDFINL